MTLLASYRDSTGQPAVMTLGVILSAPDTDRIVASSFEHYYRRYLSEAPFDGIRETILKGTAAGVFALQLHGLDHFWPPALLSAARTNSSIMQWLQGEAYPPTEALPSELQSRWIDASVLPSKPLENKEIRKAAFEEVNSFTSTFGRPPSVAVPPTFVWTSAVEHAWHDAGVRTVITPGFRCESRRADGSLQKTLTGIRNGHKSNSGCMYLVRDEYFEPALGHTIERAIQGLRDKTRMGRPTLVEIHRFNFMCEDNKLKELTISELERLLGFVLKEYPNLRFVSLETLARHINENTGELIETDKIKRLPIWLHRICKEKHFKTIGLLTGSFVIATAFDFLVRLLGTKSSKQSQEPFTKHVN